MIGQTSVGSTSVSAAKRACRVFSGDASSCLRSHGNGPRPPHSSRVRAEYDHTKYQDTFIAVIQSFCGWLGDRRGLRSHFIWEILVFVSSRKLLCLRALSEERQFIVRKRAPQSEIGREFRTRLNNIDECLIARIVDSVPRKCLLVRYLVSCSS